MTERLAKRLMTEQVMIRMTPEMFAALKADAERMERTVAQTVRLAIKSYLISGLLAGDTNKDR